MTHYIFESIIGFFIFDEKCNLIEKFLFKKNNEDKTILISKIRKKHSDLQELPKEKYSKAVAALKEHSLFLLFYEKNIEKTKKDIAGSVTDDVLLIQAVHMLNDINKGANALGKQFRELYSYYNPEFSRNVRDHGILVKAVIDEKDDRDRKGMGGKFGKRDISFLRDTAARIYGNYALKKEVEEYIEKIMADICPNITAVAGYLTGAKLLEKAGSLKHLSEMSAQTIQVLGAERALFRHLRNKKCLPPKFGLLHEHPLVTGAPKDELGKRARMLADKTAIAAKVDFFKGEFVGDKLRDEIEKRFKHASQATQNL